MRTIKTYSKGAPFYNAFLRTHPHLWRQPITLQITLHAKTVRPYTRL